MSAWILFFGVQMADFRWQFDCKITFFEMMFSNLLIEINNLMWNNWSLGCHKQRVRVLWVRDEKKDLIRWLFLFQRNEWGPFLLFDLDIGPKHTPKCIWAEKCEECQMLKKNNWSRSNEFNSIEKRKPISMSKCH